MTARQISFILKATAVHKRQDAVPGTVYIAIHTEARERLVIYQALYGNDGIFARPYGMFTHEVDQEKDFQAKQEYRFEKIEE